MTAGSPQIDPPVTLSKLELVEWLARRIDAREPTAIVRFGDTEKSMLEARPDDAQSVAIPTKKAEEEAGCRLSPSDVFEIGKTVERAFEHADVLGVLWGRFNPARPNPLTSFYLERVANGRAPAILAGCHCGHTIAAKLPDLLTGKRVSVVSCRDVKPVLEGEWGLADVAVYQIPSQHSARDVDGAYEQAMHDVPVWPDAYRLVRSELTVREPGEVFLVGAGVFGKELCMQVREAGGVAIDMGSAMDRIVGKITRGPLRRVRLLRNEGMPVAEIVAHLEKRYGVEVDPEKVRRIAEAEEPRWTDEPNPLRRTGDR